MNIYIYCTKYVYIRVFTNHCHELLAHIISKFIFLFSVNTALCKHQALHAVVLVEQLVRLLALSTVSYSLRIHKNIDVYIELG